MEERKKVYIETTIPSYLTARPASDLIGAAWQKSTSDWWDRQRARFDLYTSDVTMEEAGRGDPEAARRRIDVLWGVPLLELTEVSVGIAERLLSEGVLPEGATDDALHVGVSSAHGMDYLLTWNFRHLDNAEKKPTMRRVVEASGFTLPEICTPLELMGDVSDDR